MKILIVTSIAYSLHNFRGPLIKELINKGHEVYAAAPDFDTYSTEQVEALGAVCVRYALQRTGMNPLADLRTLFSLSRLMLKLKPDVVFSVFLKPVIYASVAAALTGVRHRYSLIAGLGYTFIDSEENLGIKRKGLRRLVMLLLNIATALNRRVIFQNEDDRQRVVGDIRNREHKYPIIKGTGVDLSHFSQQAIPDTPIHFLLVARLLKEKGIQEFAEASRILSDRGYEFKSTVVGGTDPNPGGLSAADMKHWQHEGLLEWIDHVNDIRPWLRRCHVFVLPSYREGLPRSTQEAMATGRAIISTQAPGCRETVDEGVNGFLVPIRDALALANAMEKFLVDPDLCQMMGRESRRLAEERFDIMRINRSLVRLLTQDAAQQD